MKKHVSSFVSKHGMLAVLLGLCAIVSIITIEEQHPEGAAAAKATAKAATRELSTGARVAIVARDTQLDRDFSEGLAPLLEKAGFTVAGTIHGDPSAIKAGLDGVGPVDAIATVKAVSEWPVLGSVKTVTAASYMWPTFLTGGNLRTVANRIVVIGIIAIGMTLVIITAGIDLSVGSLVALAAVFAAWIIRDLFAGADTGTLGQIIGGCGGILLCGLVGCFTGLMVTRFDVPPFIVTLSVMLMARGSAYLISGGDSIPEVPGEFNWLGTGSTLGIPHAVILMIILYAIAYVIMNRTAFGRYIYAVGGNREAARLSGVPVNLVILAVYAICGLLAGVGGVVTASKLRSGDPGLGVMLELDVIAAVVVGGTSIAGGEGKIMGTLIGALIIGVILNAMNLVGIDSYAQMVVLGAVILTAVLIDKAQKKSAKG